MAECYASMNWASRN